MVNFWPNALACLTEAVCCPNVSNLCNLQKLSLMNGANGFIHIYSIIEKWGFINYLLECDLHDLQYDLCFYQTYEVSLSLLSRVALV